MFGGEEVCELQNGNHKSDQAGTSSVVASDIGSAAPAFDAHAADGSRMAHVSLNNYKGSWLLLFFYPADFTPV